MPVYVFELKHKDPKMATMARSIIRSFVGSRYSNPRIRIDLKHGTVEFPLLGNETELAELRGILFHRRFPPQEYTLSVSTKYGTVDDFYRSFK